jgi:hypothetical protein
LAWAGAFAVLLDFLLAVTLLWPEWADPSVSWMLAATVVVVWLWGNVDARRARRLWANAASSDPQLDEFLLARREYLTGELEQAASRLKRLLQQATDDVQARLMLATILRRQGQVEPAKEQLRRLQRWRDAGRWNLEIRREWELLSRAECEAIAAPDKGRRWGLRAARHLTNRPENGKAA